jgi:folate-binding protein YgfZ
MVLPDPAAYQAVHRHAAIIDRSDRGRLVVSGQDRAAYLHGLLTNDIATLKAGEGCYAAYLTPQGRMIADLLVYELGDAILLDVHGSVKDTVLAKLDQFIFSEDVKLGDVTAAFAQLALVGPAAAQELGPVLDGVSTEALVALPEHGNLRATFQGEPAIVARERDAGLDGYNVYVGRERLDSLVRTLSSRGIPLLDAATAETIRVEGGVPAFRRDMDEETIPLEAGIESRAISFSKGCYVGQEVIIRVQHRGHGRVVRKLVGLTLDGSTPPDPGAAVHAGDREVGHVTSGAMSIALAKPVALAYVRRDFVEPGTGVSVGGVGATVTALPFVSRQG